jgi:tRNA-splicing ligase RtcB
MSISKLQGKTVDVHLWTNIHEVESSALDQLKNIAALPWVFHHVAVMPDVHFGKGATVGSVIAMKDAIAPSAVGVDIGCGMAAQRTSLKASHLPSDLKPLRDDIERRIPVGFNGHAEPVVKHSDLWAAFDKLDTKVHDHKTNSTHAVQNLKRRAMQQCGTLGGGNHFIELSLDENDDVWMVLHSGSRNIGKELAEAHIWVAKQLEHNKYIPDRDLSVFLANTPEFKAYRRDLMWAQEYAFENRQVMLDLYQQSLRKFFPTVVFSDNIMCHHNYVAEEVHFGEQVLVTRKGAINASKGRMGIIPGSMGTRSYIVRGLGNPESFSSASHGAGRRMSRGEAKRSFTLADLEAQTAGVECRKDHGVLDEIPGAYKSIDQVMANQTDLVETVHELRQVLCIKG